MLKYKFNPTEIEPFGRMNSWFWCIQVEKEISIFIINTDNYLLINTSNIGRATLETPRSKHNIHISLFRSLL